MITKMHKINLIHTQVKKDFWYYFNKYEEFDQKTLIYWNAFIPNFPKSILWLIKGEFKEKIKQKQKVEKKRELEEKIFPFYRGISK